MSNRTFTMIKPDAMKKGHAGAILDKIIKAGFRIVALKQTKLTKERAGEFYAIHKERPFYGELVDFMSSGVIIAAILEKTNAVAVLGYRQDVDWLPSTAFEILLLECLSQYTNVDALVVYVPGFV